MTQSSELWVHAQSGQRYIIPKERRIASGDYPIKSVNGRLWEVQFDSLREFLASDSEVQMFMMADLKLALLQRTPTIHPLTTELDDSSEDDSEFEDDSSEESDLETALFEALGVNDLTPEKVNDIFSSDPGMVVDLLRELEPEFEDLRESFASFRTALLHNSDATAADVLRALGEQLMAQADLLEAEFAKKSDTPTE